LDYVERCGRFLADLPSSVTEALCNASIRYCHAFQQTIGEELSPLLDPRDVLRLISPSALIIPNPPPDNEPALCMELNCEWETEHGMEWVVRGDNVLYVGAYQGTDPWADFSDEASWNYA
jgi:hypothetical protein